MIRQFISTSTNIIVLMELLPVMADWLQEMQWLLTQVFNQLCNLGTFTKR